MPYSARHQDLRLALLSLFSLTPDATISCRRMLDRATSIASTAPQELLGDGLHADATMTRFGAALVLNTLCAACGSCPRGRDAELTAVTLHAPP